MENHDLPPLIMTSEEGSYARKTIEERKPLIITEILNDFDYPQDIQRDLEDFRSILKSGIVHKLTENTSDRTIWQHDLAPWLGRAWLDIPWFLAETYFFRRVLEIVKYFQPGPWQGQDPYHFLKLKEIHSGFPIFTNEFNVLADKPNLENFQKKCFQALWGNRGDLSNLDAYETDMTSQTDQIVINHSVEAFDFLSRKQGKIAFFFDNVGKELFFDLAFVDYLLKTGLASSVTGLLKNQPFFVSDAMPEDLTYSLDLMKTSTTKETKALGSRIDDAIKSGKFRLTTPPFLTTSRMYRQLPSVFNRNLSEHHLVIMKGDVNYRRLMGDRHWHPTTAIETAGGYFPTSFLSLRTLKAELLVGLPEKTYNELEQSAEPDWKINGNRGMITFYQK